MKLRILLIYYVWTVYYVDEDDEDEDEEEDEAFIFCSGQKSV